MIFRFQENGQPDTAFGDQGSAASDLTGLGGDEAFYSVCAMSDGRIVAAGTSSWWVAHAGFVMRLLPEGLPDSTFGAAGVVQFSSPASYVALYDVACQPDGNILMAGSYGTEISGFTAYTDLLVIRLLENGLPDPDFAANGFSVTEAAGTFGGWRSLALLPDGRIHVAGGQSTDDPGILLQAVLGRYTAAGQPDTTFGSTGVVTGVVTGAESRFYGMALRSDGTIVSAGYRRGATGTDVVVTSVLGAGVGDPAFGTESVCSFIPIRSVIAP